MINIENINDIYPALEELMVFFEKNDQKYISSIIQHRLHKVKWTTRNELFDEISKVLSDYVRMNRGNLDVAINNQINRILDIINRKEIGDGP